MHWTVHDELIGVAPLSLMIYQVGVDNWCTSSTVKERAEYAITRVCTVVVGIIRGICMHTALSLYNEQPELESHSIVGIVL